MATKITFWGIIVIAMHLHFQFAEMPFPSGSDNFYIIFLLLKKSDNIILMSRKM